MNVGFDDIDSVEKSLRWHEDMKIINDFGEHVWLKPACDKEGKQYGITDCCFVTTPCDRHKKMQGIESIAKTN